MQPNSATTQAEARTASDGWKAAGLRLSALWIALFGLTFGDWQRMAHQWWNIDTYSHILLIIPIIGWLAWLKRDDLAQIRPAGWWLGLAWMMAGLGLWLGGRWLDINLFAQAGVIAAFQGATLAIIGPRAGLILAFPLLYAFALVPFGDEIIPQLQTITAYLATWLTKLSGIETLSDGIYIETPAGLFIVAEACSGVKFLIAMMALGVMVAHTCFTSWKRRFWFLAACLVVPIVANGIRAWATIFIAQYVGAEAAGSFDHIVYGWFFFGFVIALVLGIAWRWFERDPEDAGFTASQVAGLPALTRLDRPARPLPVLAASLLVAGAFAAAVRLV